MTNSLTPYFGEFLFSPIPLELSLVEPCDYSCAYCFAILNDRYWANKKEKQVHNHNIKSVTNLLADYKNRSTLQAILLQQGFPVLLSNRTDPFGRKNRSATLPVLEIMAELGIPVAFQTKGFTKPEDFDTVMELINPSWWYISISFSDDEIRKQVEPGAPSIDHRFELITALTEAGHNVCVGTNPCVPEWIGDPEPFLTRILEAGAYGTFAASLHFSKDQIAQMTEREKAAIGIDVLERASKKRSPDDFEFCQFLTDMALDMGLESSCQAYAGYTQFWDYAHECYEKTFPCNQDFVNACFEQLGNEPTVITYSDYAAVMMGNLPEGTLGIGHYIGSSCRAVTKEMAGKWTNHLTYDELLRWYWREPRLGLSLSNHGLFSYATEKDGNQNVQLIDEEGNPLMIFMPEGATSYYVDVDTLQPVLSAAA